MLKEKLKQLQEKLDLKKFLPPKYINKSIIRATFFIMFIALIITMASNGWNIKFYWSECKSNEPCKNPFYVCQYNGTNIEKDCMPEFIVPKELKFITNEYGDLKYLQPNQIIGNKPNVQAENFSLMAFLMLCSGLVVNHLMFVGSKK